MSSDTIIQRQKQQPQDNMSNSNAIGNGNNGNKEPLESPLSMNNENACVEAREEELAITKNTLDNNSNNNADDDDKNILKPGALPSSSSLEPLPSASESNNTVGVFEVPSIEIFPIMLFYF